MAESRKHTVAKSDSIRITDGAQEIAGKLTAEQIAWVKAAPEGEVPCTEAQYLAAPPFYVQFSPDQHCPETGCYLGGGERHWFASGTVRGTGSGWVFQYGLNTLGLEVRRILMEQDHADQ